MTQSEDPSSIQNSYFSQEPKHYVVEVPAQAKYIHKAKNPSGFTPMETVYLEGKAYRHVSSGRSPWWVIFTLCFLLGVPLFVFILPLFMMIPALGVGIVGTVPYLLGGLVLGIIIWRGIRAKLQSR